MQVHREAATFTFYVKAQGALPHVDLFRSGSAATAEVFPAELPTRPSTRLWLLLYRFTRQTNKTAATLRPVSHDHETPEDHFSG